MIDLRRRDGRPLRIGHRGAATLAPENTLESLRAAVAHGCEVVEFDVLDLHDGTLVLAHSDHLDEVSHGAAHGRVRDKSLAELREVAPGLPTLDEALAFFVDEASDVGLHVDLKLTSGFGALGDALARHGLASRTVVSAFHGERLSAVAQAVDGVRLGFTYPDDRLGISRRPSLWPVVALGLSTMRASIPSRLGRLTRRVGATAIMLQHRLVTERAVTRAHDLGLAVVTWTVDERDELHRVTACGVDAVVSNDPRIFEPAP